MPETVVVYTAASISSAAFKAAIWVWDDPELGEDAFPEGVVDAVGREEGETGLIGAMDKILAIRIVPYSVLR